ncbi:hypothetical protein BpHYR1_035511 [Brachionus plicatilis]|uniref:GMP phosphodiesterase delta subunit domain-containing protein n=1 Tax=Brachionus plicatilis TaxID=10195 RepID=A0A3M7SDQ2_BRAPC|nr:hypothetical protein BpHYR1_035511 [Brachionus plicatilis]
MSKKSSSTDRDGFGIQNKKKSGLVSSLYQNFSPKSTELSEKDLLEKLKRGNAITPDDILKLNGPTQNYLCKISDNVYEIDFVHFKIRDMDKNRTLFEVMKASGDKKTDLSLLDDDSRFIQYSFSRSFLKLKNIGATVEFTVGAKPVQNFLMIERHYFKNRLIKSFDFKFGFCLPDSRNSIEHIYEMPQLSSLEIEEMIANPYETKSDTFYFVDNKLIMHNKAEYAYNN